MRYMCLVYQDEQAKAAAPLEDREHGIARARAVVAEMAGRGIFRGAEPLQPVSMATSVRTKDGKVIVTDGPFAETKEQLGGYYILDCKDLDEALEWAAKIPICGGGSSGVEVRPIIEVKW